MRVRLIACWSALVLPALTHAADTATKAPAVSTAGNLLQVFIGLIAVLMLIAGVAWVAKRFGVNQAGTTQLLRVISSASVGARERIVVIEVGESWLVVGVAPGCVNALATLPRGENPATATASNPSSFAARLQQLIENRRAK